MTKRDKVEIQFWKKAKRIIKASYEANCEKYEKGCCSCEAKQVIKFIDRHIELLKIDF